MHILDLPDEVLVQIYKYAWQDPRKKQVKLTPAQRADLQSQAFLLGIKKIDPQSSFIYSCKRLYDLCRSLWMREFNLCDDTNADIRDQLQFYAKESQHILSLEASIWYCQQLSLPGCALLILSPF